MAIYDDILERTVGGRYRVKRPLGAGTFGKVFLADQEVASIPGVAFREVALKLFTQDYVNEHNARKVFAEAMLLEQLAARARAAGEPVHLVTIYDLGVLRDCEGAPFVAMECVNGSLEDELAKTHMELPLDAVLRHMRGICAGLRLAHENSPAVIHRDLKPANILIEKNGFLKVADFGLAIERHRAFLETGQAGTIAYAPPENRTAGIATPAFDVYSLGVMMIEMLTGKNPLAGVLSAAGTESEEVDRVLGLAQRRLANLEDFEGNPITGRLSELRDSTDARTVLRRCLAVKPGERYANATELDQALDDLQGGRTPALAPRQPIQSGRERLSGLLEKATALLGAGSGWDPAVTGDLLREIQILAPHDERYFALVSRWHEHKGEFTQAIDAQRTVNRIARDKSSPPRTPPDMLERLAVLFDKAGKPGAAREARKEVGR